MEQILQIGIVKFGEANYKVLSSNFVLFFTLALVFYLALFVKEEDRPEENKAEESAPTPTPSRSRASSSAGERLTSTPSKSDNTPRKETPKRGRRTRAAQSDKEGSDDEKEKAQTPRKVRSTTPRKSTGKRVDLGQVVSPEGQRTSARLRVKTPAKL